jgi:hypothetical protein
MVGPELFTVRATDAAVPTTESVTEPLTITIAPRTLTVTTAAVPAATVGAPYSQPITAVMGIAPLHWSIASGALPAGLSLNPTTGLISGIATSAGVATFKVRVTDATQPTAMSVTTTLSVTVHPHIQPAVFVTDGGDSAVHSFALERTHAYREEVRGNRASGCPRMPVCPRTTTAGSRAVYGAYVRAAVPEPCPFLSPNAGGLAGPRWRQPWGGSVGLRADRASSEPAQHGDPPTATGRSMNDRRCRQVDCPENAAAGIEARCDSMRALPTWPMADRDERGLCDGPREGRPIRLE